MDFDTSSLVCCIKFSSAIGYPQKRPLSHAIKLAIGPFGAGGGVGITVVVGTVELAVVVPIGGIAEVAFPVPLYSGDVAFMLGVPVA
jgi:hypothetical protein